MDVMAKAPKAGAKGVYTRIPEHQLIHIDMFSKGRKFRAKVDIGERNLPAYFSLWTKTSDQQTEFNEKLPADLEVFVSMDTHDPSEEDYERRLQNLNSVGRNRFNFGIKVR